MWGQLWEYPFRADVWGTVGQFVSAFLTLLAVVVGGRQYFGRKRFEERSQATQVDARLYPSGYMGMSTRLTVANNSDKAVFDVQVFRFLRSTPWRLSLAFWFSALKSRAVGGDKPRAPQHDDVQSARVCSRLNVDEIVEVTLSLERFTRVSQLPASMYHLAVFFRDRDGRRWLIDLTSRRAAEPPSDGFAKLFPLRGDLPADPYWRLPAVLAYLMRSAPFRRRARTIMGHPFATVMPPRPQVLDK